MIPFNKIHLTGDEMLYLDDVVKSGKIAGDGFYTKACEDFFEKKYGFKKALLTASCTDALELAAILIGIKQGDEVIMPSYGFSSTANAFILRGAKIVFADSNPYNPNINADQIESLITPATKAIVIVHYGGVACDMVKLKQLLEKYKLYLIEDAAQAIDCFFNNKPLGSFGHFAAFSFHETKNVTCGEGGLLVINDKRFIKRGEIVREKGTNKASFVRKEINQYNWVDIGSSFLPSDITAAYLYAQLKKLDDITAKRLSLWNAYEKGLQKLAIQGLVKAPVIEKNVKHNGHVFYLLCKSAKERDAYISYMLKNDVQTKSHYVNLHNSPFYRQLHGKRNLPIAKIHQGCLVRLPLYYDLEEKEMSQIIDLTCNFFLKENNTNSPAQ